jgi:competence protein ComEA
VVPARGGGVAGGAATAGSASAGSPGGASAGSPGGAVIDLNTASEQDLESLDGVGPAIAQKILAYRQEHGGFRSVDDLDQVSGIGPKKLTSLRPHVRV